MADKDQPKPGTGQSYDPAEVKQKQEEIKANPPKTEANADIGDLLKQINELKDNPLIQAIFQNQQPAQAAGPQVTNRGLIGTFEKYITDKNAYPDPRERLFEYMQSTPRLRQLAFPERYELEYEVGRMRPYERKDGVMETQPQFTLILNGIVMDEETFEPTTRRFELCRYVFFEDPETALVIARDNGLEVDEQNEKAFLDEMRFIRMRDWLLEAFYPPKITGTKKNFTEMSIPGRGVVKSFEISSESAQPMPFGELSKKLNQR